MRRRIILASVCVILFSSSHTLAAQINAGGMLRGWVRDGRTNQPITGALVEVIASDSGSTVKSVSVGVDGKFYFNLTTIRAVVVARAAGYRPVREDVNLLVSGSQTVMLSMYPKKPRPSAGVPPSGNPTVDIGSLSVPADAREEYREAVRLLGKKGEETKALQHLEKAVELYPEYVEAHHLLGTVHLDQGKTKEADEYLGKTLELNDKFAPAYVAMGVLWNQEKKYAEAEKMLKKGLALAPTSWQGYLELAKCRFFQGRIQDAEARGLRAHELNDQNLEIHMVLADISVLLGNLERAKEEYEHFLAQESEHPMARRIKTQIAEIDKILIQQGQSN